MTHAPPWRALGLAAALTLTACGGDAGEVATPTPLPALPDPSGARVEPPRGEPRALRTFTIALTGEVRGEIEPCGCPTLPFGGFVRRERLLERLRAEDTPLFHLDAGELLLKGLATRVEQDGQDRASTLLALSREVGVDAWAPGPTDLLALGVDGVRALQAGDGPAPVSAAWTTPDGAPLLPAATVVERAGVRLGVVGLSAEPGDPTLRAAVKTADPVEAARAAIAGLPVDLDLIVALGSIDEAEAARVSREVDGLAAVLTTRGARYEDPTTPSPGRPPVIEAPDRGRYVQVVRVTAGAPASAPLALYPDTRAWRDLHLLRAQARARAPDTPPSPRLTALEAEIAEAARGRNLAWAESVPLSGDLDGEASVTARIDAWKGASLARAAARAAEPPPPTEPGYASAGACVRCHTSEFARWTFSDHARGWESLLARRAEDNPECVACHATGWAEPGGFGELTSAAVRKYKGVQCESCHGPMRGHPEDPAIHSAPLSEATCQGCHDSANSPDFDFATYLPRATCQGGAPDTMPMDNP